MVCLLFLVWGELVHLQPDRFALRRIQPLAADYLFLSRTDVKHVCFWIRGTKQIPVFTFTSSTPALIESTLVQTWKHLMMHHWQDGSDANTNHQQLFFFFLHNGFSWTIDNCLPFLQICSNEAEHIIVWRMKIWVLPLLLCELSATHAGRHLQDFIGLSAAKPTWYQWYIYLKPLFN